MRRELLLLVMKSSKKKRQKGREREIVLHGESVRHRKWKKRKKNETKTKFTFLFRALYRLSVYGNGQRKANHNSTLLSTGCSQRLLRKNSMRKWVKRKRRVATEMEEEEKKLCAKCWPNGQDYIAVAVVTAAAAAASAPPCLHGLYI